MAVVAAAAAVVAVAAPGTKTIFRSERLVRLLRRRAATLGLVVLVVAPSCHRARSEPSPTLSATAPSGPPPSAPPELLVEGALRRPAETWRRVRTLLGGAALRLPSTFPLAITTLIGASPLVAGLIDDSAPVALAVMGSGGAATLVAGVRITSGPELVAALANGADARFASEFDAARDLTVLTPKREPNGVALGVLGNTLLLARARGPILVAAGYVARTLGVSLHHDGESLTLVARKAALVGPFSEAIQDGFRSALRGLETAAATSRRVHGRGPDFGDPQAVINALSHLADGATAVLGSAAEVSVSAALMGPIPELSIEIAAGPTGAASDLVRDMAVGDASPLLTLPSATEVAVLWQRPESKDEPSTFARLTAVLGDRIGPNDRKRIARWAGDVDQGVGAIAMVGVISGIEGPGVFAVGPHGVGAALRRAVSALPSLLEIPAIARPLEAFVGRFQTKSGSHEVVGLGATTELLIRRTRRSGASGTREEALAVDLVLSSVDSRVAMIAGPEGAGRRVADLLKSVPDAIGADPVVARAVTRAGVGVAVAGLARFRDESGSSGWAALGIGSDRHVVRVELTASDVAARALLQACLAL
jgi:hypothetical protein